MFCIAWSNSDVSRVGVDLQVVADEPFIPDHVASVGVNFNVTLSQKTTNFVKPNNTGHPGPLLYSRHSVNGPSVTGIIQLMDFYQSGNWMVELDIYGPIDHSVTRLLVR